MPRGVSRTGKVRPNVKIFKISKKHSIALFFFVFSIIYVLSGQIKSYIEFTSELNQLVTSKTPTHNFQMELTSKLEISRKLSRIVSVILNLIL